MTIGVISVFTMKLSRTASWAIVCRHSSSSTSRRNTKNSNHYENLEINSDATHNEIKSAYFKLSKKYHPDVNNSSEAKSKFNDIASAYEVLGNHGKRKQYDRGLQTSTTFYDGKKETMKETDFGDVYEEAKRAQSAIFRNRTKADGTPIYNFDQWTESHYGRLFARRQKDLSRAKHFKEMRKEFKAEDRPVRKELPVFIIFAAIVYLITAIEIQLSDYDKSFVEFSNREKTENNNDVKKSRN